MHSSKRRRQGSLDIGNTSLLKPEHSKLLQELPVGGGQFAPDPFPVRKLKMWMELAGQLPNPITQEHAQWEPLPAQQARTQKVPKSPLILVIPGKDSSEVLSLSLNYPLPFILPLKATAFLPLHNWGSSPVSEKVTAAQ